MKNRISRRTSKTKSDSPKLFRRATLFVVAVVATVGGVAETRAAATNTMFDLRAASGKPLREKALFVNCIKTQTLLVQANELVAKNDDLPNNRESRVARVASSENVLGESAATTQTTLDDDRAAPRDLGSKPRFHWKPALRESLRFLAIQHGWRVATQPSTRRELPGKFFPEWAQSIKNLSGWEDSNNFFINYIAHPLQGGLTGRIFVNNSDQAKTAEFGKSPEYVKSRLKAFVWSTAWSVQFELGPLSEAAIGNVGLHRRRGHSTMAWVDLVVTPTLGTGVLVGEDAIDKFVLRKWLERKKGGRVTTKIKILRSVLTPTTSFANVLRGKVPWERDNRK